MNTQEENQDTVQTPTRNSFPEPQTIPTGWDTSGFGSATQPVSDKEVDDLAEGESE